jgi:hypothetical protein
MFMQELNLQKYADLNTITSGHKMLHINQNI